MTVEQAVAEKLRTLPTERQQEVLNFVESLQEARAPKRPRRSLMGICADLGVNVTRVDALVLQSHVRGPALGRNA